ncbi:MAG: FdtA/QdtA family cupin domain-containing protein [Candidatus Symbiothrix sp.]|jgi:dTDP-4-dehydrorhamnose 3,5-epimerase-like enzyme|nr:FdtA/QdtA family cupin domain-containing protein [Candidatus Symbiothrix sp.]
MEENKVALFDIPRILDVRGNLSFIEKGVGLRFDMKRVYWIYDVPGGEIRGSHAFIEQEEIIIALSGSFDVVLHDGKEENCFSLNRSYKGLYIPSMYWRRMENFSTNSVCLVMASTFYREDDYIKDFELFLKMKKG